MPNNDRDDQNAELTKIKSDPRYSDMKKLVKICMDDVLTEKENINNNNPPNNEPDNIFDRLAGFFSGKSK